MNMKKTIRMRIAPVLCPALVAILYLVTPAMAAPAERYLHVRVQDSVKGENVNVNVPLSMAEQVIPAINNPNLHDGKVTLRKAEMNGVDIRAILEAVRNAPDNNFVTVQGRDANVRVSKEKGNIVVHVVGKRDRDQNVDVTVPIKVVDALIATAKDNQLDIESALRALSNAGDVLLVSVHGSGQQVRVWVDSRNMPD